MLHSSAVTVGRRKQHGAPQTKAMREEPIPEWPGLHTPFSAAGALLGQVLPKPRKDAPGLGRKAGRACAPWERHRRKSFRGLQREGLTEGLGEN